MSAPAADSAADASSAAVSSGPNHSFSGAATGRRVQPRHFHAGPNPAASSHGDAAGEANRSSPAARLHRHALESIFAFLKLGEVSVVLQVSRGFLGAVKSMSGLEWLKADPSATPLYVVAESAMARHVCSMGAADKLVSANADQLFILARHMPHLQHLECELVVPSVQAPLIFPSSLRTLHLSLAKVDTPADTNAALKDVGHLALLESLIISLSACDAHISFAPLAALPQLRSLTLRWSGPGELRDAQADELGAMPRLHTIDLPRMTTGLLRRLLRQPRDLQWQQITLPLRLDNGAAALLSQLPTLTKLDANSMVCTQFDWLHVLTDLTHVELRLIKPVVAGRAESLVAALQCCTKIRS